MVIEGQVHGGILHGIGQALMEHGIFDDAGQLVTADLMTYALPRSLDMPPLEIDRTVTPTPHNPLGAKGAGEVGVVPAAAAIVNAACDALADLGITHLDMPLTPEKIWRAMRDASAGTAALTPRTGPLDPTDIPRPPEQDQELKMAKSFGREFYDRQIKYLESGDVDGLIDNQYLPDAVLVSFDFTVRGRDALVDHFRNYLERLGGIKLRSTDKFTEIEDGIFFEATVDAGIGKARVYDIFMLKDGKILRHFTGVLGIEPNTAGQS